MEMSKKCSMGRPELASLAGHTADAHHQQEIQRGDGHGSFCIQELLCSHQFTSQGPA